MYPVLGHGPMAVEAARSVAQEPAEVPFAEAVPEDLICEICLSAVTDPVVTEECGHLFCRECVTQALGRKSECPVDRRPLTVGDLRKDVRTARKVLSLATWCYSRKNGCMWKGEFADLDRHAEQCDFASIKCPFAVHGCDALLTRRSLQEHMATFLAEHLLFVSGSASRLMDDNAALQQVLDIHQREDMRFIWVITQFESKRGPDYSRKFTARGLVWYLGVDFEGPERYAGVYLFAEGHQKRVNFSLILFNTDPKKDKVHVVNDWAADYKGKGWGPLQFISRTNIANSGFIVNSCVRVGVVISSEPFN